MTGCSERSTAAGQKPGVQSDLDFLTGRGHVAGFAAPAVGGALEGLLALVAEEGPALLAPGALNDVRVSEAGVGLEDARGDRFLVIDQIVAAKDLAGGDADDLPGQGVLPGPATPSLPAASAIGSLRLGRVTVKVEPRPRPGLSTLTLPW